MKKLFLGVLAGLCIGATAARAEGISDGTILFNVYGGGAAGLQKSGYEVVDQKDFAWGNFGGEIALSAMYFPSAYMGLGLDLRYSSLNGSDVEFIDRHGWWWDDYRIKMETDLFHLMASGRFNINPHQKVHFYIPFGAGLTVANGEIKYTYNDDWNEIRQHASDVSLGYYAGAGLEFDIGESSSLGFEVRYNAFRYDINKLAHTIGDHVNSGLKDYSYISFLISLGFRI